MAHLAHLLVPVLALAQLLTAASGHSNTPYETALLRSVSPEFIVSQLFPQLPSSTFDRDAVERRTDTTIIGGPVSCASGTCSTDSDCGSDLFDNVGSEPGEMFCAISMVSGTPRSRKLFGGETGVSSSCPGYCVSSTLECLKTCDTFFKYGQYGYFNSPAWKVDSPYTCLAIGHILDDCYMPASGLGSRLQTVSVGSGKFTCPTYTEKRNNQNLLKWLNCGSTATVGSFTNGVCSFENKAVFCSAETKIFPTHTTATTVSAECQASLAQKLRADFCINKDLGVTEECPSITEVDAMMSFIDSIECKNCPLPGPEQDASEVVATYLCDTPDPRARSECYIPYRNLLREWDSGESAMTYDQMKQIQCECPALMNSNSDTATLCSLSDTCKSLFGVMRSKYSPYTKLKDPVTAVDFWQGYCAHPGGDTAQFCPWNSYSSVGETGMGAPAWCSSTECIAGAVQWRDDFATAEALYSSGMCPLSPK